MVVEDPGGSVVFTLVSGWGLVWRWSHLFMTLGRAKWGGGVAVSILVLVDLSVIFSIIYHGISLKQLRGLKIEGTVLNYFPPFLVAGFKQF